MIDLQSFVLTVLSSAGASVALSAAAVWLARTWISDRLHASIKYEYGQRLAALNAQLKSQGDAQLAALKAEIDTASEKLKIASTSFSEVQKASIVRKLDAVDTLWTGILSSREIIPPVMHFLDMLTVDEYVAAKDHPTFRALTGGLDQEKIMKVAIDAKGSLERVRPYVGEYIWALFATFQAVTLRPVFLVHLSMEDEEKLNWHKDNGVRQLIASALGAEGLAEFDGVQFGKVSWIRNQFEGRILTAMAHLINGKEFGKAALKQAQFMEEQIRCTNGGRTGG